MDLADVGSPGGKTGLQQGRGDRDAVPLSQGLTRFCAMDTLSKSDEARGPLLRICFQTHKIKS